MCYVSQKARVSAEYMEEDIIIKPNYTLQLESKLFHG